MKTGRGQKSYLNTHFRPQKKSQTIFITQGRATNLPWKDNRHLGFKSPHFDQTSLPWLGAMSRSSLRTGYSLAQSLFFWWAQYRNALWTGILQLQHVLCPVRQFWISTKVEGKKVDCCKTLEFMHHSPSFLVLHIIISVSPWISITIHYLQGLSLFTSLMFSIKICFQKVELIHSEWHNFFKDFHNPRRFAL